MNKRVLIIGAGPAGMGCAYSLLNQSNDFNVCIVEKSPFVGGLCRSLNLNGRIVDLGPHRLFSKNEEVNTLWKNVLGDQYVYIRRCTRIYFDSKFINYPLSFFNLFLKLKVKHTLMSVLSYSKTLFRTIDQKSFEGYIINNFGEYLYRVFFKPYTEKLWGGDCKDLDSQFARQRIKGIGIKEIIKSFFYKKTHRSFVESFIYPRLGNGQLYDRMKIDLVSKGAEFKFNTIVKSISRLNSKYLCEINDEVIEFDFVVSSMPLDLCYELVFGKRYRGVCSGLKYRNTILVYFEINKSNVFKDQWLYIQDHKLQMGRLTNFNNWSPFMYKDDNTTCLVAEFWSNEDDEIWSFTDNELFCLARDEFLELGLTDPHASILFLHVERIAKSYPVYYLGYEKELETLQHELKKLSNFFFIGRSGSYKYNNQDHSLLMGILAAKKITGESTTDLWEVNTDSDFQEST